MDNKYIILHLSLIEGIGPAVIDAVLSKLPENFDLIELYKIKMIDFVNQFGLSLKQAKKIATGLQDTQRLEQEVELIGKYNINWMTRYDKTYPQLLREIHRPPTVLYWQGKSLAEYKKTIAIVGARKANQYGRRIIDSLVRELIPHGYTIISGGALGADAMAHQAALENSGQTVAVIGSGLLKPYPSSNKKLFQDIVANGGTIASPFPLQFDAFPANFPARNRIIAGLSSGCIVIQAAAKSGSKITAQFALEQGREVFAVPGPIDDVLSVGCHQLIQQGAKLVGSVGDVLQEFEENYRSATTHVSEEQASLFLAAPEAKDFGRVIIEKVKIVASSKIDQNTPQGKILAACQHEPLSVDGLIEKTNISLQDLNNLLFVLQVEGKIAQNMIGLWQAV